jgi:hypothetical protein
MRRRRSSAWLTLAALAGICSAAAAQEGPVPSGAAFLLLPVGARATALGQASVAESGSSEATFWNPAGLAGLTSHELAIQYSATFASRNTAISGHFVSNALGTIGVTAYVVDYGAQDIVPPGGGIAAGRVSPKNIELLASYATGIGHAVALGVNYTLIQFRQDCQGVCGALGSVTGTTHAADVGVQVVLGHGDALRVGVALQHVGFKLQLQNKAQADPLPTRLALGTSYQLPLQAVGVAPEVNARLLLDVQDDWTGVTGPDARMGLELGYGSVAYLRTGYAFLQGETRGASIGVGIRFDRVSVDLTRVLYASGPFEDPLHLGLRVEL